MKYYPFQITFTNIENSDSPINELEIKIAYKNIEIEKKVIF